MGIKGSSASARYSDGANASLRVEIADMGSLSGLASLAAKFDPKMEKETDSGYERATMVNGQLFHERYDRRAKSGEATILIGDRISVTVDAPKVNLTGDNQATVTFRQGYRSDVVKTANTTKTLVMAKTDGRWLIQQERVGN